MCARETFGKRAGEAAGGSSKPWGHRGTGGLRKEARAVLPAGDGFRIRHAAFAGSRNEIGLKRVPLGFTAAISAFLVGSVERGDLRSRVDSSSSDRSRLPLSGLRRGLPARCEIVPEERDDPMDIAPCQRIVEPPLPRQPAQSMDAMQPTDP